MNKKGLLITLEGPDGAGKSSQAKELGRWLKKKGYEVLLTHEPGGTLTGQKLRTIVLDKESQDLDAFSELCLYEASRAILIREVIAPAIDSGVIVIVDRFQDSTWVYQGWAGGMDFKLIELMGNAAMGGLKPHVTIVLDLPVVQGLRRVKNPNRMEEKPLAFHNKVRSGYLKLASEQKNRMHVVKADRSRLQVQEEIRSIIENVLEKYYRA